MTNKAMISNIAYGCYLVAGLIGLGMLLLSVTESESVGYDYLMFYVFVLPLAAILGAVLSVVRLFHGVEGKLLILLIATIVCFAGVLTGGFEEETVIPYGALCVALSSWHFISQRLEAKSNHVS
jgi:hypothetical protein